MPQDLTLTTEVSELPLVGANLTKAFNGIGVFNIADLLYNFPTRYMDYRKTVNIAAAAEGETVTVLGRVKSVRANLGFRGRMSYSEITLEDGTGKINAMWFNQTYIAKSLKVGNEIILSGKVSFYKKLQFTNPAYEIMRPETEGADTSEYLHTGRLVPIYRKSDVVPLRTMRRLVKLCLPLADRLEDFIPNDLKKKSTEPLLTIAEAINFLHFPETEEQILAARLRVAVDEVLPQQLAVELQKAAREHAQGYKIKIDIEKVKLFLSTLPFELTPSQKRAAWDIFQDLETGKPMNRLLQGDVGSGKTMVAILAALQTAGNSFQTAILAPTEILAKQHYETFLSIFGSPKKPQSAKTTKPKSGGIALVTRTFSLLDGEPVSKVEMAKNIKSGKVLVSIGTHALLQGQTNFKNLALLIIDEQHRFGVAQRSFLTNNKEISTHLLSMSATPIPRTLAMSVYGDLAVSTLSHIPSGAKSLETVVVPEKNRESAYEFIRNEIKNGHQAFIVTPRVEESSANSEATTEVRSVKKEFARLEKDVFQNLRLGLLYGKMKGVEKDKVMAEFSAGKIDVLVSTSVIEIGIDIPNATAMIIEGSERFGLAQLHQLRGRIGRNNLANKCFLFTTEPSQQDTKRLSALAKINDGFALAELDLQERGFGDLFGKQQSGFSFRFPQFITVKALKIARDCAEAIFKKDPGIKKSAKLKVLAEKYLEDLHTE